MRLLLLLLPLLFISCKPKKEPLSSSLRVNMTVEPSTFDPLKSNDLVSASLQFFINEGLTGMEPDNSCAKGLAEQIDISDDRLTYTFTLREAMWDESTPIIASDFVASWRQVLDPNIPCPNAFLLYPIENALAIKEGKLPVENLGVFAPDRHTLVVKLHEVTPYFLEITSFCTFFLTPPSDKVSSGPFRVKEYIPSTHLILEKNPFYWNKENVLLELIHISLVPDEMTAYHMFEKGELDLIGMPFSPLPLEGLNPNFPLSYQPTSGTLACSFNTTTKPFDNPNLRKAINYAIDNEQIVTHVSSTNEIAAVNLVPPILSGTAYTPNSTYNPKLARHYFDLAHAELGEIDQLELYTPLYLQAKKIGEVIQSQLKEVLNLEVRITHMEPKILIDHLVKKDYQMSLCMFFAQYFDAMNVLERLQLKSQNKNYPGWENPDYITSLSHYRKATTLSEQAHHLAKAEAILKQECPITPLFHPNHAFLVHPRVKDLMTNPSGGFYLNKITLD